ncbi:MAG: tRNA (adenosine(37)-N6)-dimethylallyltransferase MiaA [Bacteroidota bacterium]
MSAKKYLIVIAGPTASGKTGLGIQLAQHYKTVILSADSRQFYREMSIGTAKPDAQELAAAPHYFVNSHSIQAPYSVGDYEKEALELLEILFQERDLVLLVGGSGLFIRALCEGLDEFPTVDPDIRAALNRELTEFGIEPLQKELARVDPEYYQEVDRANPKRLIRALEVYRASGQAYSSFRKGQKQVRPFQSIYLALSVERDRLYQRINQRVDEMMKAGLLEEARQLYPLRTLNALQTVGYQELFDYFDQKHNLETAIELIKRNSRRYAKRQMTWLRKEAHWSYFDPQNMKAIIQHINQQIQQNNDLET